ncbi:MAG: aldo/keto reductase [Clostridia bacterium]|nr:aldo/keto reductase [Clostridia bacterium]
MQYRVFGKTGCKVSTLGFGAMRMPTVEKDGKKVIDEKKAIELIRHAIDSGVNYVDTAFFYHDGESEALVGKALRDGYRKKTYVATKLPMGDVKCPEDFDRLLNTQLQRLDTPYIDFYLFHALNRDHWKKVKEFGLIDKMKKAKAEGKIRHMGFSFHDDLEIFENIVEEYEDCEFCQIQLNYLDTDYQAGIEGLKKAAEKGLGLVIMEPLRGGSLANPDEDVKNCLPEGKTPVEAALSYIWSFPEVSLLLSGMGTMEQLKENMALADKYTENCLSESEIKAFTAAKKAYDRKGLIPCTKCLYCKDCPKGIDIPAIFAAFNLVENGDRRKVKEAMPDIEDRIRECIDCGACEKKCPQNIEIRKMFKHIKDSF